MGLPELKQKIHLQIENADERLLRIVSSVFDNYLNEDESDNSTQNSMSLLEQKAIDEALLQVANKQTISHELVMEETKKGIQNISRMKIEWTLASKTDYWQNIEYLDNHWSEKEVLNFINEIDYSLNLLSQGNVIFTKSDYTNVYKMVVIKQITIYYTIENETIYLLRFWNNYQDLSNFKLK